MPIEVQTVAPLLQDMATFLEMSLKQHEVDSSTIEGLRQKVAQADRLVLEKVASRPTLDSSRMDQVLSQLVGMRLISPGEDAKIASRLKEDPNSTFDLITKMAEALVTPHEGVGFKEDEGNPNVIDPDGWDDFAEGKTVKLRQ